MDVLLVKIEDTIYHHSPVVFRGSFKPSIGQPTINQWEFGTSIIYDWILMYHSYSTWINIAKLNTGWWYTHPCEKKMKVNWDDDILN